MTSSIICGRIRSDLMQEKRLTGLGAETHLFEMVLNAHVCVCVCVCVLTAEASEFRPQMTETCKHADMLER